MYKEVTIEQATPYFWKHVDKTDSCWLWTGSSKQGFGMFKYGPTSVRSNKFSWELLHEPIQKGMLVYPICKNNLCVNPDHLFLANKVAMRPPHVNPTKRNLDERFWEKVDKTEGCWIWLASTTKSGYPQFLLNEKMIRPSKYLWELEHEPIEEGMMIYPTCGNQLCIRPEHQEISISKNKLKPVGYIHPVRDVNERFWEKVAKVGSIGSYTDPDGVTTQCWDWTADLDNGGYGKFWVRKGNITIRASRFSLKIKLGEIPINPKTGKPLDCLHHCDRPICVRPEHLFAGDAKDNSLDMMAKGRHAVGDACHDKFSIEEREEIRSLYASGNYSQSHIARLFGVTPQRINALVNYKPKNSIKDIDKEEI